MKQSNNKGMCSNKRSGHIYFLKDNLLQNSMQFLRYHLSSMLSLKVLCIA